MDKILYFNSPCCAMIINYGELMPFAISAFRTEERREMNGLINELIVVIKFEKVLENCFEFIIWLLVASAFDLLQG